jgi:hypothetical protein
MTVFQSLMTLIMIILVFGVYSKNSWLYISAVCVAVVTFLSPLDYGLSTYIGNFYQGTSIATLVVIIVAISAAVAWTYNTHYKLFKTVAMPIMIITTIMMFPDVSNTMSVNVVDITLAWLNNFMSGAFTVGIIMLLISVTLGIIAWNNFMDFYFPIVFLTIAMVITNHEVVQKVIFQL